MSPLLPKLAYSRTVKSQKLISKKLESVEMSLTGVLGVIFEVDEEEERE